MKFRELAILLGMAACATASLPPAAFLQLPAVRLHYLDWKGSGDPLVLVPGGCQTAHVFGDLAPRLTGRFRVFAVTPRGCGPSGPATDGYGIDRHIEDLLRFADAMGIERAVFAGHSSGGGVVVRLASRHPERVSHLVTFDIVYRGVPQEFDASMEQAIAEKSGRPAKLSLESHRTSFQAWELGVWSDALEREFREQTEVREDGSLRYRPARPEWRTAFAADMQAGLYFETTIQRPALFFVARHLDRNRVRQFSAAQQKKLLPMAKAIGEERRKQLIAYRRNGAHVRIVQLKNASHYLFIDHGQVVASEILRLAQPTK